MVRYKTAQDIERLAEGGAILALVLDQLVAATLVGRTPLELDQQARQLLATHNCQPSFLGFGSPPFGAALCVSVNDGIVHGLPNATPFAAGDVVGIDLGLIYQDTYYLDSARTVPVGSVAAEVTTLLTTTQRALAAGIAAATIGNRIGDISAAIQAIGDEAGYGIVRQLVGHGVGYDVHEEPHVPNYGEAGTGLKLEAGLVIAIEPMFTLGGDDIIIADDGWTVATADGSLAAQFEHTVAITANGPRILT